MKNIFTDHPSRIGETYIHHLFFAGKTALKLFGVALVLMIHGLFPFIFQNFTRNFLEKLFHQLLKRNPKNTNE